MSHIRSCLSLSRRSNLSYAHQKHVIFARWRLYHYDLNDIEYEQFISGDKVIDLLIATFEMHTHTRNFSTFFVSAVKKYQQQKLFILWSEHAFYHNYLLFFCRKNTDCVQFVPTRRRLKALSHAKNVIGFNGNQAPEHATWDGFLW